MKSTKTIFTLGIIALVIAGAFVLIREKEQSQGNFVDRGNRHETVAPQISYETKTDTQGAVTVAVKPIELSEKAAAWQFEVTLDTHSVELDDDLVAQSVLVDTEGRGYRPLSWDGDPPGGHHRKGILKFTPITPTSPVITLKLVQVGGIAERVFVWGTR